VSGVGGRSRSSDLARARSMEPEEDEGSRLQQARDLLKGEKK
jgi:hypothetical protein